MAVKKVLTVDEQIEKAISEVIKNRIPYIVQGFYASMTEEVTSISNALEIFGDWLYDDGFADIFNDIDKWAKENLAIKNTVVLKNQIEK